MRLVALWFALVFALVSPALADDNAVALLPLDADAKLELYSQSVASEVARALVAGGVDVVVVGPKMEVPQRARMIVDGTITGKGDSITLTLRIRDARAGTVLGSVPATATSVTQATEDLSKKIVPAVKTQLASLQAPPPPREGDDHAIPPPQPVHHEPAPILGEVTGQGPLHDALQHELEPWAKRKVEVMPNVLVDMVVPTMPATHGADAAIALDVLAFSVVTWRSDVPLARARVRVRVVDRSQVVFDRVIVTDTVVGDRRQTNEALAARTAREVLAILEPHLKRKLTGWR
jgi:hypothetical protein